MAPFPGRMGVAIVPRARASQCTIAVIAVMGVQSRMSHAKGAENPNAVVGLARKLAGSCACKRLPATEALHA